MDAPTPFRGILQMLVPALDYGARDGFAHLSTLKNVETLVRAVAAKAGEAGAAPGTVRGLVESVSGFDSANDSQRREGVLRLARALDPLIELPEALRRLVPSERTGAHSAGEKELSAERKDGVSRTKASRHRRAWADLTGGDRGLKTAETEVVYRSVRPSRGPLSTPIGEIAPLRGRIGQALRDRGLDTVGQALFFFPRTYEDRRKPVPIARLKLGERGVSIGTVKRVGEAPTGRGRVFRIVLGDSTGTIAATWYHAQPWMRHRYQIGERYVFSGEIRAFQGMREVAHPEMEPAEQVEVDGVNFGRIVPVYPGFERIEQRAFRAIVHKAAERYAVAVEDPLPAQLLEKIGLPPLARAIREVHFPEGGNVDALLGHASPAQRRLAFDELFFIELGMALRRKGVQLLPGIAFQVDAAIRERALRPIPFCLTEDQTKALDRILGDMAKPEPMNRLLQGDVGSGKTAVAVASSLVAVHNGYQAAFMAPTEILAEQHLRTMTQWLRQDGLRVDLLTAGVPKKQKEAIKAALAAGETQIVIGTHALLQEDVKFKRLGFAVIDEQHRFGVLQRARLMQKGVRPDVLVMTATPIPRTLAMTLYGDLDVSVIRSLPPGRQPVATRVFSERQRARVYELVARELEKGRQAYVVYPLVEESEKVDLKSATEGARHLAAAFPDLKVGLIHGRMAVEEKDAIMRSFRGGDLPILVSTTVVEVGVDVPNATVMVVESAERFGLSQLHQLRGRVGRGTEPSFCFLVGALGRNEVAHQRLQTMARTNDGFEIAEKDLELRGPGEMLGTRQSGVPGLVVADLLRDQDLLEIARDEARLLVEDDPGLDRPEHALLRRALDERWEGKLGLSRVG